MPIDAIQSTPALWALVKVVNRKRSRSDPHREFKIVAAPSDLDDVEPQEQDLDANPSERRELVLGDRATDGGLILELVRPFQCETAGTVQISSELTVASVQFVTSDALREQTHREVEVLSKQNSIF